MLSSQQNQTKQEKVILRQWQAQLAQAVQKPWLASALLRHGTEAYRRFVAWYRLLAERLARRGWRVYRRKWQQAIGGAALLLALNTSAAFAGTITVGGGCTLADAIRAANTNTTVGSCTISGVPGADDIVLSGSTYTYTNYTAEGGDYQGYTALPAITSTITVQGNGATIERGTAAVNNFRLLYIDSPGDLTLDNVTIRGGYSDDDGGAVYSYYGNLTIQNSSVITGNYAAGNGGGIESDGGDVTISNSNISGNISDSYGGGMHFANGTLTINNSTLSGNRANGDGGAFYSDFVNVVNITNSIISGNYAYSSGGGIEVDDDTVTTIVGSTFTGNTANDYGGGVSVDSSDAIASITNSTISGNYASDYGGGVNSRGELTITRSSITGNDVGGSGGGVSVYGGTATINQSLVTHNSTDTFGGGVYIDNGATATIRNSTISGNRALTSTGYSGGGGIYNYGTLYLYNSTLSGNSTAADGGGLKNLYEATLVNTTITGNNADGDGGGIFNFYYDTYYSDLKLYNTIIANSIAGGDCVNYVNNSYITADSNSLVEDGSCVTGVTTNRITADPNLGPLTNNGGPLAGASPGVPVVMHALPPLAKDSPAINAGSNAFATAASLTTDQRGAPRVQAGTVDIGAFEAVGVVGGLTRFIGDEATSLWDTARASPYTAPLGGVTALATAAVSGAAAWWLGRRKRE